MSASDILLIFIRAPEPGAVKTRLAADIGDERACAIYAAMAECTVALTAGDDAPWEQVLWVHPPDGEETVAGWLATDARLHPQSGPDLGANLTMAFQQEFDSMADRVVVIGTDCPAVTADVVADAFDALRSHALVIGPATDGGYYLIGMAEFFPEVFENIPWGTDAVFETTMTRLRAMDLNPHVMPPLSDIDTLDDVEQFLSGDAPGELNALKSRLNAVVVGGGDDDE